MAYRMAYIARRVGRIAGDLEAAGFSRSGKRYAPTAVARMLGEL